MSGAHVAATAGATAAAAAAKRMREEEERLTTYNKNDMDGWEFKIVRANTRFFKKPENLRTVCEEEARAGWEMVEKFDDMRVRFKRRVDKRRNDQFHQGVDPYRTHVGIGEGQLAGIIVGVSLAMLGLIIAIVMYIKSVD